MDDLREEEWERVFRLKRHMESLMEHHTLADVMAREKSPYLASHPGKEGNRHERRAQARNNRHPRIAELEAENAQTCMRCDRPTKRWLCDACAADELWERENWEEDYADDDEFDDCGLMPNGQCLKAGSEECDWECGRLH